MRIVALTAAALCFASLAHAEQTGTSSQAANQRGSSGSTNQMTVGRPQAASMDTIKESLEKAGFQNVRVVDAAYLVHATTKDNDFVVMTINPPSRIVSTDSGPSKQSQGSSQ
jgi:hypothetical protein